VIGVEVATQGGGSVNALVGCGRQLLRRWSSNRAHGPTLVNRRRESLERVTELAVYRGGHTEPRSNTSYLKETI
jgi:hypothetical protein